MFWNHFILESKSRINFLSLDVMQIVSFYQTFIQLYHSCGGSFIKYMFIYFRFSMVSTRANVASAETDMTSYRVKTSQVENMQMVLLQIHTRLMTVQYWLLLIFRVFLVVISNFEYVHTTIHMFLCHKTVLTNISYVYGTYSTQNQNIDTTRKELVCKDYG